MLKGSGILAAALLALATFAPAESKTGSASLDSVLKAAVEQGRVPAVVAMLASPAGVTYEGAFGVGKDAIFAIASMTKPITSVAVMQLVESGKVKLDEPAATYLPELATLKVLDGDTLRPPRSAVTVRQLLAHTSGFGYEFLSKPLFDQVAAGKVPSMLAAGDAFLHAPLTFDPGEGWQYGISTDWLGRLVEKVSGQTLDAYLRQRVFEPLGMSDTYFNVPAEKQSRLARHYRRDKDGRFVEEQQPAPSPVTFFSGGGGLYSTATDYLTFARALMADGQLGRARILSTESVALAGRNQIGALPLRVQASLMPQLVKDGPLPGRPDKFGLGFAMNTSPIENGRGANTLGWAGVHNTFFWIDRAKGVCAVVMMQVLPFMDDGPRALVEDFERAVYAQVVKAR
jgi:CubicO group peptidase (beta-lactamase class C family)